MLSHLLFSLYANDLEIEFVKNNWPSIELQMINILVMFADYMVITFIADTSWELKKYDMVWFLNLRGLLIIFSYRIKPVI